MKDYAAGSLPHYFPHSPNINGHLLINMCYDPQEKVNSVAN